ncbi:MAG: hypothetical protein M0D55_11750 [Elusimicrobiota bacterium]|nr:MAG: hypothetical protein M0D55_11750 [Elusimicrobiota bacterium]
MITAQRRASAVELDYPQEGEIVSLRGYTIRLSGPATAVEIAVDGGEWLSCRRAAGHWWCDWSGYGPGRHQILVRSRDGADGDWTFRTRRFLAEETR